MTNQLEVPGHLFTPPQFGQSQLPIVEPIKSDVQKKKARVVRPIESWPPITGSLGVTSLGPYKEQIQIREWDLYTAIVKTELAYQLSGESEQDRAFGAYWQNRAVLNWNPANLRLASGAIGSRKDSARTALAGRFGEAVMYLYMVSIGYRYWDHLPSLADRVMEARGYSREDQIRFAKVIGRPKQANGRKPPEPDFVFENEQQAVALAESKGSFVGFGKSPPAKTGLSTGLKQLKPWMKYINPPPERCFAIGTYLREIDDSNNHGLTSDPSLIAVVDPEGDEGEKENLEIPADWVRRGNYGSWMSGMGLRDSAYLLATGRTSEIRSRRFMIINLLGHDFAIRPAEFYIEPPFEDFFFCPDYWHAAILMGRARLHLRILGITVEALSLIEKTLHDSGRLLEPAPVLRDIQVRQFPNWFSGSIMPDGTIHGMLHLENLSLPKFRIQEFKI